MYTVSGIFDYRRKIYFLAYIKKIKEQTSDRGIIEKTWKADVNAPDMVLGTDLWRSIIYWRKIYRCQIPNKKISFDIINLQCLKARNQRRFCH